MLLKTPISMLMVLLSCGLTWLQMGPHSSLVLVAQILVDYLGNLNCPEFFGKQRSQVTHTNLGVAEACTGTRP